MIGILGIGLIIIGVTVLVLVDFPWVRRLGRRGRASSGSDASNPAQTAGEAQSPDDSSAASVQNAGTESRQLAPGWYRDPENPALARYWDGTTLSEERRPVAHGPHASRVQ